MRITALLFALMGSSAFAIVNGELVTPDQYPAQSAVIIMDNNAPICTGTLIGQNLVLTAAHCLVNDLNIPKEPKGLEIYFGNIQRFHWNKDLALEVSELKVTDNYNSVLTKPCNDLAVVKFSGAIPPGFSPVEILKDPSQLQTGTQALIAGYGNMLAVDDASEPQNRTLRSFVERVLIPADKVSGMIEFYSTAQLVKKFGFHEPQTPHHPELKNRGGMAAGDSGGPAYVMIGGMPVVAGVASGYKPDAYNPYYENVATHAEWIEATAKALDAPLGNLGP